MAMNITSFFLVPDLALVPSLFLRFLPTHIIYSKKMFEEIVLGLGPPS